MDAKMKSKIAHFLLEVILPNFVFSLAAIAIGREMNVRVDYIAIISTLVFGGSCFTFYFIEKFRCKSLIDNLTGLNNREFVNQKMNQLIKSKQEFHFLLLDLNRFKNVNDTLGHSVGDKLLVEVAKRLQSCCRNEDVIARLGGDEFGIITTAKNFDFAAFSQRIISALQRQFIIGSYELSLGVSIGVAKFGEHGEDAETLVKNADAAMYHAKREKLGFFRYNCELDKTNLESLFLSNDLRVAIEKKELFNEYQPKIDINTGEIVGVECLCRWVHAEYGRIPPDKFIPLAEQEGLIDEVLFMALENALRDLYYMSRNGLNIGMSVNISAENLTNPEVISRIISTVAKFNIDPALLTLEITETAIAKNLENTVKSLTLLGAYGIKLSIDDFGTGYSSYFYLKHLPVSELKIDKSFVEDALDNVQDYMIINSIIQLAHSAKCTVVAEGVENAEQLELMKTMSCDFAQGNFTSPSLSIAELMAFKPK